MFNIFMKYYSKNAKKASAYIDHVKKVLIWCKEAEWLDLEDSSKPTLNFKLLELILEGFVRMVSNTKF